MHENTFKRNQLLSLDDENTYDFNFLLYNFLHFKNNKRVNFIIIKQYILLIVIEFIFEK